MIINDRRSLAYIVTIDEIKPIEGYDRVEYARTILCLYPGRRRRQCPG